MAPAPDAWRHTRCGGNSPCRRADRARRSAPGEVRGMYIRRVLLMVSLGILLLGLAVITAIGQPQRPPIDVMFTSAGVPLDVERAAPLFARAAERTIPLIPQTLIRPHGGGTIKEVRIRALHDGKMIYIELSWSDTTSNATPRRQTDFTDAA